MPLSGEAIRLMNYIDDVSVTLRRIWPLCPRSPRMNAPGSQIISRTQSLVPTMFCKPSKPSKALFADNRDHRGGPPGPAARCESCSRRLPRFT